MKVATVYLLVTILLLGNRSSLVLVRICRGGRLCQSVGELIILDDGKNSPSKKSFRSFPKGNFGLLLAIHAKN